MLESIFKNKNMEKKESVICPQEILAVSEKLETNGFPAYLVGGCVRDMILNKQPKDWDITTSAKPEEIQKIFPDSVYENNFGTVGIKTGSEDEQLKIVEATTFRSDGKYTDFRHPDEIIFSDNVEDDLSRRDFTINAMAIRSGNIGSFDVNQVVVDPFNGLQDLKEKLIKAVRDPNERFQEDALRMMRAIRFASALNFKIEENTKKAIEKNSELIKMIAIERVRDEFKKIIMTGNASQGIRELEATGILEIIIPELCEGIGVAQNRHHIYEVFEHNILALDYAAKKDYSFEIRLSALLHDIGKPRVKYGVGENATFYNHEMVSAKMAARILDRMKFPKEEAEKIIHLIRYHMFYYDVGELTEAGVRRFLARVGPENVDELMRLREADRIGSNVPKAVTYRMRHLLYMIEKVKRDPISPKMLKINGDEIMKELGIYPSPRIGWLLSIVLESVLDDPQNNDKEKLMKQIKKLNELSDVELKEMADSAKDKKEEVEIDIDEKIKNQFYVK